MNTITHTFSMAAYMNANSAEVCIEAVFHEFPGITGNALPPPFDEESECSNGIEPAGGPLPLR
jgi:hypothetical protein